jgi:hypothetical protein
VIPGLSGGLSKPRLLKVVGTRTTNAGTSGAYPRFPTARGDSLNIIKHEDGNKVRSLIPIM